MVFRVAVVHSMFLLGLCSPADRQGRIRKSSSACGISRPERGPKGKASISLKGLPFYGRLFLARSGLFSARFCTHWRFVQVQACRTVALVP